MVCPNCKTEYVCPCPSCAKTFSKNKIPWISHDDDTESCPTCGLRKHLDEWLNEEGKQYNLKPGGEKP